MRFLVALLLLVIGCSSRDPRPADTVPASWRDVRESAGHTVHVGKANVACKDCHGERTFGTPPADLCEKCHGTVQTPLHGANLACQSCHGFGKDTAIKPAACMRCHEQAQGWHVKPVG